MISHEVGEGILGKNEEYNENIDNMELYSWMHQSLFIYSSVEGHLGCFQVLAIKNKATQNICV